MKKSLSILALLFMAFVCPAVAQIVIDEITIQTEESYTVNKDMVVRFKVNNNAGVPLQASDYSLTVNVGGVYAGKPEATKDIANGTYESFMAKVAPHTAGENLPVEIVLKGMGTTKAVAEQKVTVNAEVPSGDVQVGNCAKPSSDADYTNVLNTYYDYSQTEIVYTAADLGLADGTLMTGLSFTGYRTNERIVPVKVWVELTDDVTPKSTGKTLYTSDNLVKVYDDNYSFKLVGDTYTHESVFSVNFPTPINYVAGKSIRVIVQTEKASSYSYTYISIDKTKTGQVATRSADDTMAKLEDKEFKTDSYGTPYYLPVLKLAIEKDPTVVDGTVTVLTKSKAVEPLANATVALANGNVMYFATTDAQGKYNMNVAQDKLTYNVTVEPADVMIFPFAETLALAGTSATKDLQVEEAYGAYILDATIPETAVVNTPVTVKAKVANYEAVELTEENGLVSVFLDDQMVDFVDEFIIDAFDEDNLTLSFTPHEPGTHTVTVAVNVNSKRVHEVEAQIEVAPEMATYDFTINGAENSANETTSPIRLYSTHSYSQTLLTADMLKGLSAGSKVVGMKLESAQSTNSKNFNFDVKVWVMNTEDGADNITTDPHSADFKQVYEATLVQRSHGKYNDGAVEYENFIDLVFDEPFVYEGKNIRIAMRADIQGSGYQQTYFKAIKDVRTSWSKSSDNPTIDGVAVDIMDYTWASAASQTPVFTLVVDNASVVQGTVVDKATSLPIENATVTLSAQDADVVYTATSDATGFFELTVVQASHNFTAYVSAPGYLTATVAVPADFTSPLDLGAIKLEAETPTGINDVNTHVDGAVYDIAGRKVTGRLGHGIYVINGKKVLK